MYDTEPGSKKLKSLIEESKKSSFSRKLVINAVDANTGEVVAMTDSSVPFSEFHNAILASASVPALFPPV